MANNLVVIESPYAGDTIGNIMYARRCMRDCFRRGEIPFASHLLYTQALDDNNPEGRKLGIESGYAFGAAADKVVFYTNLGWSNGMLAAKDYWEAQGKEIEIRKLDR